jgi:hypothetical protein
MDDLDLIGHCTGMPQAPPSAQRTMKTDRPARNGRNAPAGPHRRAAMLRTNAPSRTGRQGSPRGQGASGHNRRQACRNLAAPAATPPLRSHPAVIRPRSRLLR